MFDERRRFNGNPGTRVQQIVLTEKGIQIVKATVPAIKTHTTAWHSASGVMYTAFSRRYSEGKKRDYISKLTGNGPRPRPFGQRKPVQQGAK